MMRLSSLILFFALALPAQAGTISLTATGVASQAADFVSVSVSVHSKCYKKSSDAAKDNAQMANDILAILKKYEDPKLALTEKDLITVVGGYFLRQTEISYQDGKSVVLCTNGWRTEKDLTLKLAAIDKLAELQDEILAVADRAPEVASSGDPQTWAVLGNPAPALTASSQKALAASAVKKSIQNAKDELSAITGECGLRGVKLLEMKVPEHHAMPANFAAEKAAAPGSGSPFLFGSISASVTRIFSFQYENSLTCRR